MKTKIGVLVLVLVPFNVMAMNRARSLVERTNARLSVGMNAATRLTRALVPADSVRVRDFSSGRFLRQVQEKIAKKEIYESQSLDDVKALLDAGANINGMDSGETILHTAVKCGYDQLVRMLLESQADVNVKDLVVANGNNFYGAWTPLHHVANRSKWREPEIIKLLLEHKADIEATDWTGNTPLHVASRRAVPSIIGVLIEGKANVNAVNNNGDSPLHCATRVSHSCGIGCGEVKLLIDAGAAVNAKNKNGETPLFVAVKHCESVSVRTLLAHGADVCAVDAGGNTPLHAAARCGAQDDIKILIERKANIDAVNNAGRTPLYEATERADSAHWVRILLLAGAKTVIPEVVKSEYREQLIKGVQQSIRKEALSHYERYHELIAIVGLGEEKVLQTEGGLPAPGYQDRPRQTLTEQELAALDRAVPMVSPYTKFHRAQKEVE